MGVHVSANGCVFERGVNGVEWVVYRISYYIQIVLPLVPDVYATSLNKL